MEAGAPVRRPEVPDTGQVESTSPKQANPVTTSVPCGPRPETATVCGEAGSFDSIVIVAPIAVGRR